ncbi:MAG: hypothetical protein KC431_03595, partial [Myxococcales bacterium]|nr:hypothetical protein [Myxococcales bacterium]
LEFVAEVDERGTLGCGIVAPLGEKAWREGASFSLSYLGEMHPVIARALTRFMARYDGAPLQLILDQVVPDPGDEHMIANDYDESVFYAYAPASGWRRFFEGTELYRGTCGGSRGKVAVIDHTDIECLFNQVSHDARLPSFFNTPDTEELVFEDGRVRKLQSHEHSDDVRLLFTDIGDIDVIKGADKLVDEALELLATLPDKPDSVIVQSGCLPDVTGDDLEASAARTRDKLRLPVFAVGQHNDPTGKALGALFAEGEHSTPIALDRPLDETGMVVLGMPAFVGSAELTGILGEAGIRVLAGVLPQVMDDACEQLLRASLLVEYPWDRYRETARRLGERLAPARVLRPPAPFGLDSSRRWLLAIGAAMGRRAEVEAALDSRLEHIAGRWRALQARARQLRVGFVVEHGHWRSALSARRSLGLPMLEVVSEMGFGVDILAYAGGRGQLPAEQRFDDIRVRWYRSVDELDALLADEQVAAWYSELHYDRRISRNGKNTFSMREFAMGPGGALSNLESMLRVAELPFYRSYARYLGPSFLDEEGGRPRSRSTESESSHD